MIFGVDSDFLCYYQAHAMTSKGGGLEKFTLQEFTQHCLRTLNHYTSKVFGDQVSHMMFFFDEGKSWRYDYLNSFNVQYKDRDKTKRELTNFHEYRIHLRQVLAKNNFAVIAVPGYEADDVMHVASQLLETGELCLFTGDSDLQQMLHSDINKEVWIVNPLGSQQGVSPIMRTVYQPVKVETEDDYFGGDEVAQKFVETFQNVKIVDPAEKVYIKMICGDSGDTIPSAFQFVQDGKAKTVGETRAEKFHRDINPAPTIQDIRDIYMNRDLRVELAQKILSYAKLKAFNKINDFERAIYRNIKCILLDDIIYEPDVLKSLKDKVSEQMKPSPGASLAQIFRGTEYDFQTNYYKY